MKDNISWAEHDSPLTSSGMHWQYVLSLGDAYRARFTFMRRQHDLDQAVLGTFPAPMSVVCGPFAISADHYFYRR